MRAIRSKATKPELLVRKWLWSHGYRYRLNVRSVPGSADIVMRKYRTAIFVNGCFWHAHEGCSKFVIPSTRREWWIQKFETNKARDERNYRQLQEAGWQVIVLWQCQLSAQQLENTMQKVAIALNENLLKQYSKQ